MANPLRHHYSLTVLHLVCLGLCGVLLVLVVWAIRGEEDREWRRYQRLGLRMAQTLAESRQRLAEQMKDNALDTLPSSLGSLSTSDVPSNFFADRKSPRLYELHLQDLPLKIGNTVFERRDRCVSCHLFSDWTAPVTLAPTAWPFGFPGKHLRPGWPWQQVTRYQAAPQPVATKLGTITILLPLVSDIIQIENDAQKNENSPLHRSIAESLGIRWMHRGIVAAREARIGAVAGRSPAEAAGLMPGDRILQVGDKKVASPSEVEKELKAIAGQLSESSGAPKKDWVSALYPANFGASRREVPAVTLLVERGFPQPFSTHPHGDLYVSPTSPHPMSRFGCTICHDGVGLATDVGGAEHFRSEKAAGDLKECWRTPLHPMPPTSLIESRCLRCHGRVFDLLETRDLYPIPAPHLVAGRRLIERFGCYACHRFSSSGGGEDMPGRELQPAGPALEVAEQVLALDPPKDIAAAARRLFEQPPGSGNPEELLLVLETWAAEQEKAGSDWQSRQQVLQVRRLAGVLRSSSAVSGRLAKPGPSLRYVSDRYSSKQLALLIANPQQVNPRARMPRLFGIQPSGSGLDGLRVSIETVEITGIAEYLLTRSQSVQTRSQSSMPQRGVPSPGAHSRDEIAVEEDALPQWATTVRDGPGVRLGQNAWSDVAWGRVLFETQGCLACHTHREFPEVSEGIGPDLSDLGRRFDGPYAAEWLERWLQDPHDLAPETRMPRPQWRKDSWLFRLILEAEDAPARSNGISRSQTDSTFGKQDDTALHAIRSLVDFLLQGGPNHQDEATPDKPASDQVESSWEISEAELDEAVLAYLSEALDLRNARQYARHGVSAEEFSNLPPAMATEVAELIGPLTREKKLRYVGKKAIGRYGCNACHNISGFEGYPTIGPDLSTFAQKPLIHLEFGASESFLSETAAGRRVRDEAIADPEVKTLLGQRRRESWLWIKLTEPRAFDYRVPRDSPLHQLRMGRFPLSKEERWAIMTFLLGLDGYQPPPDYSPYADEKRAILAAGRGLLERHGCERCHMLRPEVWIFRYLTDEPPAIPERVDSEMSGPEEPLRLVEGSPNGAKSAGNSFFGVAVAVGRPQRGPDGNVLQDSDEWDNPLYFFELWQPVQIANRIWPVGSATIPIAEPQLVSIKAQDGGQWGIHVYPRLARYAQDLNVAVGFTELWGAVPPPLCYEGVAVQETWLREFLRQPSPIRPAVPFSMPVYNLSDEEIEVLVQYFQRRAGGTRIPPRIPRPRQEESGVQKLARLRGWEAAEKLIRDEKTYCGKCHRLGSDSSNNAGPNEAPPLDAVYRRLRGEYISEWIKNPRAILPYTAMPINFPTGEEPLDRSVFDASPDEQRHAVVDLLEHYDQYLREKHAFSAD